MIVAVVLLALGLAVVVIAGLGVSSKLPGNSFVGIRVPEVRRDPEMWALAHRVAGPSWLVAGLALLVGGFISFSLSGWGWLWALVAVLAAIAMIGVGSAMGAHTVAVLDAKRQAEADAEGCGCGDDGCGSGDSCEDSHDPASDCGVAGGCGACALNGACEGGGVRFADPNSKAGLAPAVDLAAATRAADQADK